MVVVREGESWVSRLIREDVKSFDSTSSSDRCNKDHIAQIMISGPDSSLPERLPPS
jgi:hypothetical protein